MASNSPIPPTRLSQIANDACTSALSTTTTYEHAAAETWNSAIINSILKALISESEANGAKYKFSVNSTIIQHLGDSRAVGTEEGEAEKVEGEGGVKPLGRRGMHSASGAYWNNERDGMWSYKFEGGEGRGMDVVVSVIWIGV